MCKLLRPLLNDSRIWGLATRTLCGLVSHFKTLTSSPYINIILLPLNSFSFEDTWEPFRDYLRRMLLLPVSHRWPFSALWFVLKSIPSSPTLSLLPIYIFYDEKLKWGHFSLLGWRQNLCEVEDKSITSMCHSLFVSHSWTRCCTRNGPALCKVHSSSLPHRQGESVRYL